MGTGNRSLLVRGRGWEEGSTAKEHKGIGVRGRVFNISFVGEITQLHAFAKTHRTMITI